MGKDFIPLRRNGIDDTEVIKKLYHPRLVRSASKEEYFHSLPSKSEIEEIELGDAKQGTHETVFEMRNGDFIEVGRTLKLEKLKKVF